MWTCPKCSYRNGDESETCFSCGKRNVELFGEGDRTAEHRSALFGCIFGAAGLVLTIVLTVLIVNYMGSYVLGHAVLAVLGVGSVGYAGKSFLQMSSPHKLKAVGTVFAVLSALMFVVALRGLTDAYASSAEKSTYLFFLALCLLWAVIAGGLWFLGIKMTGKGTGG
jgi:NAD/NADP transhydrogenase beta subunit